LEQPKQNEADYRRKLPEVDDPWAILEIVDGCTAGSKVMEPGSSAVGRVEPGI
jgi:hypothetical protein